MNVCLVSSQNLISFTGCSFLVFSKLYELPTLSLPKRGFAVQFSLRFLACWYYLQAPLTEEFIFRACMLPLLVPSLGEGLAIFICPLLFGVGKYCLLFAFEFDLN